VRWRANAGRPNEPMKTTVDKELKRKITERWKILACGIAQLDVAEMTAFAQLDYILSEAGLLARPRKRRRISPDSEAHAISVAEAQTAKAESDSAPTLSRSGVGERFDEAGKDEKWEAPRYDKEEV